MPLNFEPGQGVTFDMFGGDIAYGVVARCDGSTAEVALLHEADSDTRCYDEGGSKYETDRHKVRPRGCPPPFRFAYGFVFGDHGAYIDADPAAMVRVDEALAAEYNMCLVGDENPNVAPDVKRALLDHQWWDEKERQKRPAPGTWQDFAAKPEYVPEPASPAATSLKRSPMDALSAKLQRDEPDEAQQGNDGYGPDY